MQPIVDVIRGAIKINNLPDLVCGQINSFADAIKALPNYLTIELPASASGVIFGAAEPSEDETNKLWVRTDLNGNVLGLYVFTVGEWRALYLFPPGHIEWIQGNSTEVPAGFQLIDNDGPTFIPSSVRSHLQASYQFDPTNTYFLYYAAAYVGY